MAAPIDQPERFLALIFARRSGAERRRRAHHGIDAQLYPFKGSVGPYNVGEQPLLQRCVGQCTVERPNQTDRFATAQRQPHRRWRNANPPRDLARRHSARLQSQAIAHKAHRDPLHRHQVPPSQRRKNGT
jgi:hypothetical protein